MIRRRRNNLVPQIWLLGGEQKGRRMDEPNRPALCRRLIRRQGHAALATSLAAEPGGQPYASLVALACDHDGSPLLLLSDLAQHSRNIAADNRVSLLFDGAARDDPQPPEDPLAAPRLGLLGTAERCDDRRLAARFVARHPSAAGYAGFGDFRLYRVTMARGHLIAGFGRISWIDGAELRFAGDAPALAAAEAGIVAHMNADHADALALYAERLLGRVGEGWRMTGIDPEGIDLRRERDTARVDFSAPVLDAQAARQVLIDLVREARAAQQSPGA
jgi:putative heme iron utilization protein